MGGRSGRKRPDQGAYLEEGGCAAWMNNSKLHFSKIRIFFWLPSKQVVPGTQTISVRVSVGARGAPRRGEGEVIEPGAPTGRG